MRELVINLETTSRCNRKCTVCPQAVNESGLVKKDMSVELVDLLLKRVVEARRQGIVIREISNAGYGETYVHSQFAEVCERFARFKADRDAEGQGKPLISIVSNASLLDDANLALTAKAVDILKISFPTCDPAHYGDIMAGSAAQGPKLLEIAKSGLARSMALHRDGAIAEMRIHISPPTLHTHEHLPETLDYLTRMAAEAGLQRLNIVAFSTASNRAGTVNAAASNSETYIARLYRSHRRRFHRRELNGVVVDMLPQFRMFFPRWLDVISMLSHRFPCIWKAGSMAIDSSGNYRLCINDAASKVRMGNLQTDSIASVVEGIRTTGPGHICEDCNQHPKRMGGDLIRWIYRIVAAVRMRLAGTA